MQDPESDDGRGVVRPQQRDDAMHEVAHAMAAARGGPLAMEARRVLRELDASLAACATEEGLLTSFERMATSMTALCEREGPGPLDASVDALARALAVVHDARREAATR